jgi:hypothetical protein
MHCVQSVGVGVGLCNQTQTVRHLQAWHLHPLDIGRDNSMLHVGAYMRSTIQRPVQAVARSFYLQPYNPTSSISDACASNQGQYHQKKLTPGMARPGE